MGGTSMNMGVDSDKQLGFHRASTFVAVERRRWFALLGLPDSRESIMLRIRDEQVLSLRKSLTADIEDELVDDVKHYFEERITFLGDAQTHAAVRHGIERAAHYGFTSLRGWALYVTLSFVLGSHFDKNPLYPWVHKNLVTDRDLDEKTRTHRFYNALRRYSRATRDEAGVYNEPILYYPETSLPAYSSDQTVEQYLVTQLEALAQAHFNEAGEDRVRELVRLAIERAAARGIMSAAGLSIYVPLTFLLGVGFDEDPQFPWAIEASIRRETDGPDSVAWRLHEGAIMFRRHCLKFVSVPKDAS